MAEESKGTMGIYITLAVVILLIVSPLIFGGWVLVIKLIQFMSYSPGGFPIWAVAMLALVALVIWRKKAASYAYI